MSALFTRIGKCRPSVPGPKEMRHRFKIALLAAIELRVSIDSLIVVSGRWKNESISRRANRDFHPFQI